MNRWIAPIGEVLSGIATQGETKRLLLHCCCAPCASYVLEYLSPFFKITALFFNPNITPRIEHEKRFSEMKKLLARAEYPNLVDLIGTEYAPLLFEDVTKRFREEPEGGRRCRACFELRLKETAVRAKSFGFDYFTTTLSVSPHKDAALLSDLGGEYALMFGCDYLHSDFKKKDGYKRSVELSKLYGLYRQDYCGCTLNGAS